MEKREFDIFEFVRILLQNRWFIIIFVGVVSVAAVVYSLLTPQIWESRTTFYVVGDQAGALPFDIAGLSGLSSELMGFESSQSAINAVSAMQSRTFSEDVIRHFNLIDYFEISEADTLKAMDIALKRLWENTVSIFHSTETGLVKVSVETKDKELSRDIAEYYLERLDIYNREQKLTRGRMNRQFLEERVEDTRSEIDSLILAVRDFQEKNNALDLEVQTEALIDSYAEVVAARMQTDIELELARGNYSEDSPVVSELKNRSDALSRQIREMESGGGSLQPRYMVNISKLPDLASRFAQLQLNLEIQSKVYEYLYPQYEAARLEEMKDMPTLDILDTPREAGMRLRPKRAVICVIAFILAFIVAVIIVLIKNMLQNNKDRLQEIKKSL
jgi:capsule polysaccharide export protein KpsE/RkpR